MHRITDRAHLERDRTADLYAVRDAPTLDAARAAADRFENAYRGKFPAAVACFADDRDARLAIHRVPVRRRIRVRTTNLSERNFEERRRTKVIPRLMDEKATMKLVFATMIRAAERWCECRSPTSSATGSRCRAPSLASTHHWPRISQSVDISTAPQRARRPRTERPVAPSIAADMRYQT